MIKVQNVHSASPNENFAIQVKRTFGNPLSFAYVFRTLVLD